MLSMFRDPIRRAYEELIWDSSPQGVILYACDEGETAWSTSDGSYSQFLLDAATMTLDNSDSPFVSVGEVHDNAVSLTQRVYPFDCQHPQIIQPRCAVSRQLPFAVNAGFF